jgi:hypothetical protein
MELTKLAINFLKMGHDFFEVADLAINVHVQRIAVFFPTSPKPNVFICLVLAPSAVAGRL